MSSPLYDALPALLGDTFYLTQISISVGSSIVALGGLGGKRPLLYETAAEKFDIMPWKYPYPRGGSCGTQIENSVFMVGGSSSSLEAHRQTVRVDLCALLQLWNLELEKSSDFANERELQADIDRLQQGLYRSVYPLIPVGVSCGVAANIGSRLVVAGGKRSTGLVQVLDTEKTVCSLRGCFRVCLS